MVEALASLHNALHSGDRTEIDRVLQGLAQSLVAMVPMAMAQMMGQQTGVPDGGMFTPPPLAPPTSGGSNGG